MCGGAKPQVCVISGESGAGKTETAKHLIGHVLDCSAQLRDAAGPGTSEKHPIAVKILQINPILESFGNAKTAMNSNSSRFGKYIELQFGGNGEVLGASLSH